MALAGPHQPTAAQLAQLQTLQAAATTAAATEATNLATYNTSKIAAKLAAKQAADYSHFIYGGATRRDLGVVDGDQNAT